MVLSAEWALSVGALAAMGAAGVICWWCTRLANRARDHVASAGDRAVALARLVGDLTHELNNLLTSLSGNAELLREDLGAGAARHREFDEIRRALARSITVSRSLNALGWRGRAGGAAVRLEPLFERLTHELRDRLPPGVRLELACQAHVEVAFDAGQLARVVTFLIEHAGHATPRRGAVAVDAAAVEREGRSWVAIHVRGGPRRRPQPASEPALSDGVELGVRIARAVVELRGGVLEEHVGPDGRTASTLLLPVAARERGDAAAAPAVDDRATVLVCEREPALRDVTCRTLRDAGYRVLDSAAPDDALRVAREHQGPLHLLLTDLALPGIGGDGLARELRRVHPGLGVLLVAGDAPGAQTSELQGPLRARLLRKPFGELRLLRELGELMQESRAQPRGGR